MVPPYPHMAATTLVVSCYDRRSWKVRILLKSRTRFSGKRICEAEACLENPAEHLHTANEAANEEGA